MQTQAALARLQRVARDPVARSGLRALARFRCLLVRHWPAPDMAASRDPRRCQPPVRTGQCALAGCEMVSAATTNREDTLMPFSVLKSAVIKDVLDHVVDGPTVAGVQSAGRLTGLFTFRSGIDCRQTKKLTDAPHGKE